MSRPAALNPVEAADIEIARAVAPVDEHPAGHLIGKLGALGDQPPLRVLTGGLIVAGWLRSDRRMAAAGVRMLAAHTLATFVKTRIKKRIDRSRPAQLVEQSHYEAHPGDHDEHALSSFPSGHTAGLVAVAGVAGRRYPEYRIAAWGTAGLLSVLQIPRRAHYLSDVLAGAAIGAAAAALAG